MKIEEAIQQRQFHDQKQKAGINLLYTASWFSSEIAHMLKPHGISMPQFNIMRILRGQKGQPASLRLVTERMLDKQSNTSRLIDKLIEKGLVERHECPKDRRQVDLWLTEAGKQRIEEASETMYAQTDKLVGHMSEEQLTTLSDLLDQFRQGLKDQTQ